MTAWLRALGNAELLAEIDALRYELAETMVGGRRAEDGGIVPTADPAAATLAAARAEWQRRVRLHGAGADVPDPRDRRYQAWSELARQVRERASIVQVFAEAGFDFEQRAGGREWCGPCPLCRGKDRFRVFAGPPGRYWCRRCGLTGDVITAARSFLHVDDDGRPAPRTGAQPEPDGFYRALTFLAGLAGVPMPTESRPAMADVARADRPRRAPTPGRFEYVAGSVRMTGSG
jgi:hypothetical protein